MGVEPFQLPAQLVDAGGGVDGAAGGAGVGDGPMVPLVEGVAIVVGFWVPSKCRMGLSFSARRSTFPRKDRAASRSKRMVYIPRSSSELQVFWGAAGSSARARRDRPRQRVRARDSSVLFM